MHYVMNLAQYFQQHTLNLIVTLVLLTTFTMASNQEEVAKANDKFAMDMYQVLSKNPDNVFFSPLSAHAALSMCYQGAAGSTYEQFASTLHLPSKALAAEGYSFIMESLNKLSKVTLHIANQLFLNTGYELQNEFQNTITKSFKSSVQTVTFSDSKKAAATINDWVKTKTKDKIQDLFEDDAFDGDTQLVLVNAIYFKGDWESLFAKDETRTQPFYVDEQTTVSCQMMHKAGNFRLIFDDNLGAQVLELPYANEHVSMVIMLPYQQNDMVNLEAKLSDFDFDSVLKGFKSQVVVALPKFKIETHMELEDTLTEMGLGEIFDIQKCNLTNMLKSSSESHISKVVQKAFIEINEKGCEAAAATGSIRMRRSLEMPSEFIADRPFIFSILHKESSSILFHGKIVRPVYQTDVHDEL